MKVSELIEKLKALPQDIEVLTPDPDIGLGALSAPTSLTVRDLLLNDTNAYTGEKLELPYYYITRESEKTVKGVVIV